MDPTTVFCPNLARPARGHIGQGNIGIHAQKEQRFLCTACRKTFTTTQGTALSRLRTAADTVSLVVTLMAHGCPLQAIVVAFRGGIFASPTLSSVTSSGVWSMSSGASSMARPHGSRR